MQSSRSTVDRLNDLYFGDESSTKAAKVCEASGEIKGLPLWRVQWNAIPGCREVYNVHVPHYTNMFESILRSSKKPRLFGHSFLPGGSKNLRNQDYALEEGTKAALTGTLMEILESSRSEDGCLCVVAQGIGRFRVERVSREAPHFEVDARLVLDDEEVQHYGDDAVAVAWRAREIEYPSDDVVAGERFIKVPQFASISPTTTNESSGDVDDDLIRLELQVWTALVRCSHLLLQCLKRQGVVQKDAKVNLPSSIVKLQPPDVANKILVGAECLGEGPPCVSLPPHRRAMRFSFVALAAVAQGLLETAAPFVDAAELGVSIKDKAEARQLLLEHASTHDRLTFVLKLLDEHASRLTAFLLL